MHRLALAVLVLALAGLHLVPPQVDGRPPAWVGRDFGWTLALMLPASAAWLLLCREVVRGRFAPSFAVGLGLAALLRLLVLPLQPATSDDVYRYLHEGQMVLAGQSPYATAPADVDPTGLAGPYWQDREATYGFARLVDPSRPPTINNPDIPAAYPPAMQYALALGALLYPAPAGMKVLFGLFDLLAFAVLWRWLLALGLPGPRALVYGLCPLTVLEFAGEGHGDSLAVLLMLLASWAAARARWFAAGGALAGATAAKFLPGVLLPFLLRRSLRPAWTFAAVLLLLYLPFVATSGPLFEGLGQYAFRWRSNDSAFYLVHEAVQALHDRGWFAGHEVQRLAKVPIAFGGLLVLGWAWVRRWPLPEVATAFFVYFVAFTPTMHPWYYALLLPFLAIHPNAGWLAFGGTLWLAYHVLPGWLAERRWEEVAWVKWIEYAPFYAGFLPLLRRRQAAGAAAGTTGGG